MIETHLLSRIGIARLAFWVVPSLFIGILPLAARGDLLAGWDFQTTTTGGTATIAAPNTPTFYNANVGTGQLYLDGTHGSSAWQSTSANPGTELNAFAGTTLNTTDTSLSTVTTGAASLALAGGTGLSANGKSIVFALDMSGYHDLSISYATQATATGFNNQSWSYSTDDLNWTTFDSFNPKLGGSSATTFATVGVVTLNTVSGLDNSSTAYIRLTLTGASASGGNNRLDNIQFNASEIVEVDTAWSSPAGGNWSDAANWTNGVANNSGGNVYNATVDTAGASINVDSSIAINSLNITHGTVTYAQGISTLNVNNDVTHAGAIALYSDYAGDDHRLNIGGTLTNSGSIHVERSTSSATSTFSVGGAVTNTGYITAIFTNTQTGYLSNSNSGSIFLSGTSATVNGGMDNKGYLYIEYSSVLSIEGSLLQQSGTTLTDGQFIVASSTLEWDGADIHTIGENAYLELDGASAIVRDRLTQTNAITNLQENDGNLIAGTSAEITIGSDFINKGFLEARGGLVSVNGALTSQSGTTLTEGVISARDSGIIEWNGADIHTIGSNAGVVLSNNGIIRDRITHSDALANLETIDGKLLLSHQTLSFSNSLSVNGTLGLGGGGDLTTLSNIYFGANSTFMASFDPIFDTDFNTIQIETGLGNISGAAILNGTLFISFEDIDSGFLPDASSAYTLLQAASFSGTFTNAPENGSRVAVYDASNSIVGTFAVNYSDNSVTLSSFTAVPEPQITGILIATSLGIIVGNRRLRRTNT